MIKCENCEREFDQAKGIVRCPDCQKAFMKGYNSGYRMHQQEVTMAVKELFKL